MGSGRIKCDQEESGRSEEIRQDKVGTRTGQVGSIRIGSDWVKPVRSDRIRSDHITVDPVRSGRIRSEQVRIRSDQVGSGLTRFGSGQIRSDRVGLGHIGSDQVGPG